MELKIYQNLSLINLKVEIWKDIPGYENLYQVSNSGNVKSLLRKGRLNERILKPSFVGKGYLSVILYTHCKRRCLTVHKLVAMAFLNHKPDGMKLVVDHINNIKTDNRVENLQLTTQRANCYTHHKSSSKYTGVSWGKLTKKWMAQIHINGKKIHLGLFDVEHDAHLAYQKKLKEITE